MNAPVLSCAGLRKRFGELEAVRGISFVIAEGETYGLLGPNGAGKTTSISMICGLLEPDGVEVIVAGQPLTTRSVAARAAIGYVPQELAIYPDLTARENLAFFARLYGLGGEIARARIDEVLGVVGLSDRSSEQTKNYSGSTPTVGSSRTSSRGRWSSPIPMLSWRCIPRVTLEGSGGLEQAAGAARALAGVRAASVQDGGLELIVDHARTLLPELIGAAAAAGVAVSGVEVDEPDLEAVFLHLTGRALRD